MEIECKERIEEITSKFKECRKAISAMGDETRQLILITLLESDFNGIRVGEITEKTHLSRPAVSHHLKILKEAEIVNVRREGTKNYYYIDFNDTTIKPVILFWKQAEPMLKRCIREREKRL